VFPIIDNARLIEKGNCIRIQALALVLPDPFQRRKYQIGTDTQKPLNADIPDFCLAVRDLIANNANLADRIMLTKAGLAFISLVMADVVRRIGKALRQMQSARFVSGT